MEKQPKTNHPRTVRNIVAFAGFFMLCGGSFAVDWRAGLIVCGSLLLVAGVTGMAMSAKAGAGRK